MCRKREREREGGRGRGREREREGETRTERLRVGRTCFWRESCSLTGALTCAPPACYSSSSLCGFLPRAGPRPFRSVPFCGRSSWPRSRSAQATPPWPSSLSRSESERMRAEEVGGGTAFRRAGGGVTERMRSKVTEYGRLRRRRSTEVHRSTHRSSLIEAPNDRIKVC